MDRLKALASTTALGLMLCALATGSASATIITDGTKAQLKTGTNITAETEGKTTLDASFGSIECGKSHLGGKTSNDGGGVGTNVNVTVENFTWSECNAAITVLAKGTLSIAWTSGNNGTLTSTGTELTVSYLGNHCIFKTTGTKLGTITGSATTGGNATLDIEATIPRTGGTSGALCGAGAQWTGSYKFTSPSTLNIDEAPPPPGATLTDGSGTLKTGTSITAENEGETIWDPPIGSIGCKKSHLGGKTTNEGGATTPVNISVEALNWTECNATITVLAKGTLSIVRIGVGTGNGTLTSTGTELTTQYFGYHCIYRTNNTKLGTITGSSTTKGNATLDIEATIPRTGGTSGAFCGLTIPWTGAYKFTSPSVLNVD